MLLAIDTCGATGGVALGAAGGWPGSSAIRSRELAGKTFSELLLSSIAAMLQEAGIAPGDLTGVVVVNGPGSFTGIRIGVSAAKGLAEALGIPAIALSRLELLARKSAAQSCAAVLDAGRGEYYAGFYRDGIRQAEALMTYAELAEALAGSEGQAEPAEESEPGLEAFPRATLVVCEEQLLSGLDALQPKLVPAPSALDAFAIGRARFNAGVCDDVSTLDANYLRRSETEMLARIAEHSARRAAQSQASATST